jgi:hypothetical protein
MNVFFYKDRNFDTNPISKATPIPVSLADICWFLLTLSSFYKIVTTANLVEN